MNKKVCIRSFLSFLIVIYFIGVVSVYANSTTSPLLLNSYTLGTFDNQTGQFTFASNTAANTFSQNLLLNGSNNTFTSPYFSQFNQGTTLTPSLTLPTLQSPTTPTTLTTPTILTTPASTVPSITGGSGVSVLDEKGDKYVVNGGNRDTAQLETALKNEYCKKFSDMAKEEYTNTAIIDTYTIESENDWFPKKSMSLAATDSQINEIIDYVDESDNSNNMKKIDLKCKLSGSDFTFNVYTSKIRVYTPATADKEGYWSTVDKLSVTNEMYKDTSNKFSDTDVTNIHAMGTQAAGFKKFLNSISNGVRLGLIAGSVSEGFNVGSVYSTTQKSLYDVMEKQPNGCYDFKNMAAMKTTFDYYMSPLFGKIELTTDSKVPQTNEEWVALANSKSFIDSSGTSVVIDNTFNEFRQGLSEEEINDKGLKITGNVLFKNGVSRFKDVAMSKTPKSVISYTMKIAYPYLFQKRGSSYALNTSNLRVETNYFYCVYNDIIYDSSFEKICNRGDINIERTKLYLYNQKIKIEGSETPANVGVILIGEFEEVVIDTTEEGANARKYATGRKIGFSNGYSDLLILDKPNVNLMYCTSEGGKQGYLPKNVAFLPSEEETGLIDHNRTLVAQAALEGKEGAEVKYLPFIENNEIYTEVADLENHLYFDYSPDSFKVYILFDYIKNINNNTETTVQSSLQENTSGGDDEETVTEISNFKENGEYRGFLILRNNRYINDSSLISWLKTNTAQSITYVDAAGLLAKITGDFTQSIKPLTYDDWKAMQGIKSELQYKKDMWLIRLLNVMSIVMGVFLIIFAILICMAYWIDIFNTLMDFSILQFISFGNLYPVENKELIPRVAEDKSSTRYVTFKDVLVIAFICCALGILFLNVTDIITLISYIYSYIMGTIGVV